MNTAKKALHTPGPWEDRGIKGQRAIFAVNPHRDSKYLLNVADVKRGQGAGMPIEEMEANARLIAAAPDLKAELSDLIDAVRACAEKGTIVNGDGHDGVGYLLRVIDKYKAIAKAEGR